MSNSIPARIENGKIVFNPTSLYLFTKDREGKTCDLVLRNVSRTGRQNRSLHLWLTQVSDALNEAGYNVQLVLSKKMEVQWSPALAKELLWRPAQEAITGKVSTTELSKQGEIDEVIAHLNRHLGEKFGIEYIPLPAYENEQERVNDTL